MPRPESHEYHLNVDRIEAILEANHITHAAFAFKLGYSRSYWSLLVNGHRRLTPTVRRCLLGHDLLAGIPEDELWTRTLRRGR